MALGQQLQEAAEWGSFTLRPHHAQELLREGSKIGQDC